MGDVPTLYEWAGGRAAIERMINRFYDRVEGDDLLSPFFPGGVSAGAKVFALARGLYKNSVVPI